MGDFGGKLRQARERRGISLRQIAAATKISVGVLEALERNDISKLPGGIFSRAFVRSYATEVGLDPDETVRDFLAEFPGESTAAAHAVGGPAAPPHHAPAHHVTHGPGEVSTVAPDESQFESQQRMASVVLRLLLFSIPIALVILYFSMRGGAPPPAPGVEAAPPSSPPPQNPVPPAAVTATPPTAATRPAAPETKPKPVPPAPAPAPPAAPAETATPPSAEAEPLTIELRPTAECWVSVAVDGVPAFSRTMQAGEREARSFREEVVLTVGNGAACEFLLNGRQARPLGGEGEARKVRITRQNLTAYLP
jgi:cytoskeletal protein RodZ